MIPIKNLKWSCQDEPRGTMLIMELWQCHCQNLMAHYSQDVKPKNLVRISLKEEFVYSIIQGQMKELIKQRTRQKLNLHLHNSSLSLNWHFRTLEGFRLQHCRSLDSDCIEAQGGCRPLCCFLYNGRSLGYCRPGSHSPAHCRTLGSCEDPSNQCCCFLG